MQIPGDCASSMSRNHEFHKRLSCWIRTGRYATGEVRRAELK